MGMTKGDKEYYSGWKDGYKHALKDIRQELLDLEEEEAVSLNIYNIITFLEYELKNKGVN